MRKIKLALFSTMIISSQILAQNIVFQGMVSQSPDAELTINMPVAGKYFVGNKAVVQIKDGKYHYEAKMTQPGIVSLSNNFRTAHLFVEPDKTYVVNFDKEAIQYVGNDEVFQTFLNELGIYQNARDVVDIKAHTTLEAKQKYYSTWLNATEEKLKKAVQEGVVPSQYYTTLYNLMKLKIQDVQITDYFFTYREQYEQHPEKWEAFKASYLPAWELVSQEMLANPAFGSYAGQSTFIDRYKSLKDIETTGKVQYGDGKVPFQILAIQFMRKHLPEHWIETAWANKIHLGVEQYKFEKEWLDNFVEFKAAYGNSVLMPWVTTQVKKVEDYHDSSKKNEAQFVKDYQKINSFQELFKSLKGKVTYIDLWATWCAPCRTELQFSKKNHHILEEMGVQSVYLSVDVDKSDALWKKMISNLGLSGWHLRSNATFKKDIDKVIGNGIPYYIILGKDGAPKVWGAKRPSDQQELFDQLKAYLE